MLFACEHSTYANNPRASAATGMEGRLRNGAPVSPCASGNAMAAWHGGCRKCEAQLQLKVCGEEGAAFRKILAKNEQEAGKASPP